MKYSDNNSFANLQIIMNEKNCSILKERMGRKKKKQLQMLNVQAMNNISFKINIYFSFY